MKKVKLGFVGLSRGLSIAMDTINLPNVEISAVCDLDAGLLNACVDWLKSVGRDEGIFATASFEELLASDINAVVIATAATEHTPMAIKALEAGKHVLSEIPAVNTLEEAKELTKACKSHPELKYIMAENCCFWAFINTWKSMVEDGTLGDIWYAEAEYLHNITELMHDSEGKPTWRASYDSIKYLTHDLGPLLYIMNDRVISVSGFAPDINAVPDDSTGTPNEVAIFRTAKGAIIKILVCFGIERPSIHNYCLYGTKGTLETDRMEEAKTYACLTSVLNIGRQMFRIPTAHAYPGYEVSGHGGADAKMMEGFADCIINNKKPPIDISLGLNISMPGIYAHMSTVLGGTPIEIPYDFSKI